MCAVTTIKMDAYIHNQRRIRPIPLFRALRSRFRFPARPSCGDDDRRIHRRSNKAVHNAQAAPPISSTTKQRANQKRSSRDKRAVTSAMSAKKRATVSMCSKRKRNLAAGGTSAQRKLVHLLQYHMEEEEEDGYPHPEVPVQVGGMEGSAC